MHYSHSRRYFRHPCDNSCSRDTSNSLLPCRNPALCHWIALITAVLLITTPSRFVFAASQDERAETLALQDAIAMALQNNPGLAAMQARAGAMAAIPSQAGALPDPMLSLNAMNFPTDTFDRDQEPMTQLQIGIEQALPFPGKLDLKERAAECR